MTGYLLFINFITFFLFGYDKRKARKNEWRISEKTLLLLAAAGGAAGAWLGMYVFRHKTMKKKFTVGVPVILILQTVGILHIFFPFF